MKKLFFLTLLLSLITLLGCAGLQQVSEKDLKISKVTEVPGITRDEIFDQTKIYIAENFLLSVDRCYLI